MFQWCNALFISIFESIMMVKTGVNFMSFSNPTCHFRDIALYSKVKSFYCSYLGPFFLLDLRRGLKKSSSIWTKFLSTYTSALSQKRRVLLAMIPLVLKTTWAQKVHFLLPPLALCRRSTMCSNQVWCRIIIRLYPFPQKVFSFYLE